MNKVSLIGILISFACGLVAYISSNNMYVGIGVLICLLFYFIFVINKRFARFFHKIQRFHECYHFINNFIVSLSIKGSIPSSLENASYGGSDEFLEEFDMMSNMKEEEKILYLKKYFPFHSYQLFSDIVLLWCDEGGDILSMSNHLSNQLREEEDYIAFCEKENKKRVVEFSILWIFALGILFSLRFVLKDFYSTITKQLFYPIAIAGIFLLVAFSIELITKQMINVQIKGFEDERK